MNFSEKNIQMLCQHPLFEGCEQSTLSQIFSRTDCTVCEIGTGKEILSPKSKQKCVGMLLSGKAIVNTPDESKSVLLRYLSPGDLFGIANLFTKEAYVSVIHATSPCKVFYITEHAIRALFEADPDFLYRYLAFLSGRICYLNQKIGYLTAGSTERRLALYLLSLNQNPIKLPLSLSALSELLDVGRASLYRAFDRLTADGYLKKDGRIISLTNTEQMTLAYN